MTSSLSIRGKALTESITLFSHMLMWNRGADKRDLQFSCYNSDEERLLATSPHPLCIFPEASDTAVGKLWAEGQGLADRCFEKMKDVGEFIGTAFTARDVMQIVDALDEGPLLNYYGTCVVKHTAWSTSVLTATDIKAYHMEPRLVQR